MRSIALCWGLVALLSSLMAPASARPKPPKPPGVEQPKPMPKSERAPPPDAPQAEAPLAPAPDTATADPSAPLPPLPDLGVVWPTADAPPADLTGEAATEVVARVRYEVELRGLGPLDGAEDEFNAASELRTRSQPANSAQIRLRAENDVDLVRQILRSRGYYGGAAVYTLTPAPPSGGRARVVFDVTPGELYRYSAVNLPVKGPGPADALRRELGLKAGDPVEAAPTLAAEGRVRVALPNLGYPFGEVGQLDILIDTDTRTGELTLPVDTGPPARFGALKVDGKPFLGTGHYWDIARFRPGERYDQALVEDFRRALLATQLYSSVSVSPVRDGPGPDGSVLADLDVKLTPGPQRTIAAQLGYDTIDGVRAELSWRHKNLIQPEGAVTFRLIGGTRQQLVSAELIKSNFHRRDRFLTVRADAGRQDTPAFESTAVNGLVQYENRSTPLWQKRWTWSLGGELLVSRERDRSGTSAQSGRATQNYYLGAFPLGVAFDTTKSLLNPVSGVRADLRVSPEFSLQGDYSYVRARLQTSGYIPVARGDGTVLAGRIATGAIVGSDLSNVPPSRRWYVGGGGSVRGYGYQLIGPKDASNNPTGGRSFVEFSGEVRQKVTQTIGLVAFLDGGQLYPAEYPRIGGDFQYGAGVGVRYYTSIGPIRADIATPLNPRRGDPDAAVYFSIGQAF
ncbi:MAG: BamA/TamA family outer membrane protein [Sphingomonadaceae bacterium]|nr:BamA/TamA family outer membrane protein [Sphingomonadaceae bacterium]